MMNNRDQNKKTLPNAADFMGSFFGENLDSYKPVTPIKTGYTDIDNLLGTDGLLPGTYAFGAGSGLGKSTLAQNILENIAESGGNALLYSLELSQQVVVLKGISRYASKNFDSICKKYGIKAAKEDIPTFKELFTEKLEGKKKEIAAAAYKEYKEQIAPNFYIREKVPMGADGVKNFLISLEKEIKELSKDKPCVVVIDYFQYLYFGGTQEVRLQMDEAARRIQELADKYKVPIILINSFSKAGDSDTTGSDNYFKESGGIKYTAIATLVLSTAVDASGKPVTDDDLNDCVYLRLRKNRFGVGQQETLLALDGAHGNFIEVKGGSPTQITSKIKASETSVKRKEKKGNKGRKASFPS